MPCYFISKIHSLGVCYRTRQPWQNQKYQKGRNTIQWVSRIALFTTAATSPSGVSPLRRCFDVASILLYHPPCGRVTPARNQGGTTVLRSFLSGTAKLCWPTVWIHYFSPSQASSVSTTWEFVIRWSVNTHSIRTKLGHMELDVKLWPHRLHPKFYAVFLLPLLGHTLGQRVCYWN